MASQRPSLLSDPFAAAIFRDRRRQSLLTHSVYQMNDVWLEKSAAQQYKLISRLQAEGDTKPFGQHGVFLKLLQRLQLHYTAGESIEDVSDRFDDAFSWFCKWHIDYPPHLEFLEREFDMKVHMDSSPLMLDELEDYHAAVTVLGLAVLLGKGHALVACAAFLSRRRGQDILVEELLSPAVEPVPCNEFYHAKPYDPLIDSFFTAETSGEAARYVDGYLREWYAAMQGCAWHDGHLITHDDMQPYYGYWSFEAAAICLIRNIDDSGFRDHMVYPKDLIDWARANDSLGKINAEAELTRRGAHSQLRCQSGDSCPQEGHWFTPARVNSKRYFRAGEKMPDVGGPWGLTIWQWDGRQ